MKRSFCHVIVVLRLGIVTRTYPVSFGLRSSIGTASERHVSRLLRVSVSTSPIAVSSLRVSLCDDREPL